MENPRPTDSAHPKGSREESRELRLNTLRTWYLTTMKATDKRWEKVERTAHAKDDKVQKSWRDEKARMESVAAMPILDMVGKEEESLLREAVAPEELGEVLRRAGAGYDTLMIIGEGTKELHALIEQRQAILTHAKDGQLNASGNARFILEHLESKLRSIDSRLTELEKKPRWQRTDAQQHRRLQAEFSEAARGISETLKKKAA